VLTKGWEAGAEGGQGVTPKWRVKPMQRPAALPPYWLIYNKNHTESNWPTVRDHVPFTTDYLEARLSRRSNTTI